jgi:RNase H-fold protein (predicted Holliday junction resolvase)
VRRPGSVSELTIEFHSDRKRGCRRAATDARRSTEPRQHIVVNGIVHAGRNELDANQRGATVTRRERVIRGEFTSDHLVQFFDTTDSMADTVSTYLAEGYRTGEYLLIVAKRRHWRAIAARLRQLTRLASRLPAERITVFDAERMLARFMRSGLPDSVLFHRTVGEIVHRLGVANGRRLRIYGEMVEVLAEEGNFHAAQRLEELWNELAVRYPFTLLCGYAAAHFAASGAREALTDICRTHTHVRKSAADPLAQWILNGTPAASVKPSRSRLNSLIGA